MRRNNKHPLLLLLSTVAIAPAAYSDSIIFSQDFGCNPGINQASGACAGQSATPQTWTQINSGSGIDGPSITPSGNQQYDSTTKQVVGSPNVASVKESIYVGSNSSTQSSAPNNFSVTPRNWDIHDGSTAVNISGYRQPGTSANPTSNTNMKGNMLGMVVTDSGSSQTLPGANESNFYQISGLKLDGIGSTFNGANLSFDFDSYIWPDGDGFALAIATSSNGGLSYSSFSLLTPTAGSAMQYRTLPGGVGNNANLSALTGQGATATGFDGNGNGTAGTALFDLSGFAGKTVALRFAFTTNSSTAGSADGINIDNIKISESCTSGSTSGSCTPPPGVPEPASMALVLLGVGAAYRRRPRQQS